MLFSAILMSSFQKSNATSAVTVYTPYTKITVAPGEPIDYSVDVINNSSEMQNVEISVTGIPKGWKFFLKSGGLNISKLAILPGEKKNCSLRVEVPFQVNKGSYRFSINAAGLHSLPLVIVVSEQGTFSTEFTTDQIIMEGRANSTFTFSAQLKNRTAEKQFYGFYARAPRGWEVTFKANFKQVTSIETEPNSSTSITVEVNPPDNIKEGRYKIPVTAGTSSTKASLDLEVVVTGTYSMEVTAPQGLLSAHMTSGREKKLEVWVVNTGSSDLKGVSLSASKPNEWVVEFEPKIIESIEPGKTAQVIARILPDRNAIAGDYVTSVEAITGDVRAKTQFRISVKTRVIWGWVGIMIMAIALSSIYYIFRKYGRR